MQQPDARKPRSRFNIFTILPLITLMGSAALGATPGTLTLPANSTGADIQKALDESASSGEVVLSAGTYEISQPLLLRRDGATLRGSGAATILHLANHADCPVVVLGPPIAEKNHVAAHLRLANLVIDGNRKNQNTEFWRAASDGCEINNNGIQVWNATDAAIENVVCRSCRSGGLVTAKVRSLVVSDYDAFDNQFDGLACYETEDSHFSGLRLHDNLAAGISLDLAFNHNFISDAQLAGNDLGIFMRDSRNNSFQSVTIRKSHANGIFIAQADTCTPQGWKLSPGTECTGNNFEKLMVDDCGGMAFLVNDTSCTNNAISGASFLNNIRGGLVQPDRNLVTVRELVEK